MGVCLFFFLFYFSVFISLDALLKPFFFHWRSHSLTSKAKTKMLNALFLRTRLNNFAQHVFQTKEMNVKLYAHGVLMIVALVRQLSNEILVVNIIMRLTYILSFVCPKFRFIVTFDLKANLSAGIVWQFCVNQKEQWMQTLRFSNVKLIAERTHLIS